MSKFQKFVFALCLVLPTFCFAQAQEETSANPSEPSQSHDDSQQSFSNETDSQSHQTLQPAVAAVVAGAFVGGLGAALWKLQVINRSVGIPLILAGGASAGWGIYEGISLNLSNKAGAAVTWTLEF